MTNDITNINSGKVLKEKASRANKIFKNIPVKNTKIFDIIFSLNT